MEHTTTMYLAGCSLVEPHGCHHVRSIREGRVMVSGSSVPFFVVMPDGSQPIGAWESADDAYWRNLIDNMLIRLDEAKIQVDEFIARLKCTEI